MGEIRGDRPATEPPVTQQIDPDVDPYPGLWRRSRRKKLLAADGACPARLIEIDVIVASRQEWDRSVERHEANWSPQDLDGVILAEKTIG